MERRNFLAALASIPLWARPALPSESEKTGVKHYHVPPATNVTEMYASNCLIMPTAFRAARDFWGEDCEVIGHPAQKASWNQTRLLTGNPAYSQEWNEALVDYFLGSEFTADYTMPMDEIHFRRNGKVVGKIRALAIPFGYMSVR
jgi:hypothetical protein